MVIMNREYSYSLPVGYHDFHKKQVYNFQFNRWHSVGFARFEDMKEAGERINNFSDWKRVMVELAQKAEAEGRLKNAAIYYRGAEFYITQKDPDKIKFYDKFIELFYKIFEKDGIISFKIPYNDSFLHALKVPVTGSNRKGTILMHGGFDSFIEEFYYLMKIFADNGYEVIAYEGPGQGGTRRKYGLAWDEKWEKPTKTIIDFFKLKDVTIYGISMGGHLCLRAAAFESRIKRVVTSGGAVNYWKIPGPLSRGMLKLFLHFENFTTKAMIKKMKKDEHHNWFAENSMYISNIDNPLKASMKMMDMTDKNSQPERITQDVLILSARNDHFVPIKLHKMMIKSLKNAKSVKGIIYTKETSANNHCQIGNIPLVGKDIVDWIEEKST
jgi:pimeloyl-ACP methyl ester carboxylesterase